MKRLVVLAALAVALPFAAAACGSSSTSQATLPPIATTSTTSTTIATTTTLPEFYVVQSDDTLGRIAAKLGVSKSDLIALNGITNPDHIEKGQKLKVPRPGVAIPTTLVAPGPPATAVTP